MKTLIVFREGQSGNFVKSLIQDYAPDLVNFRVADLNLYHERQVDLTHEINWPRHSQRYNQVLRILPERRIYAACYNNWAKKVLMEQVDAQEYAQWTLNPPVWYDRAYYNICEYHQLITQDLANNQYPTVINFDHLTDLSYVTEILDEYFGLEMTDNRRNLFERYCQQQLPVDLDLPADSMQQLCSAVPVKAWHESPWFFAWAVHRWESMNNLQETHRTWSINHAKQPQTPADLVRIADSYRR